MGHAAIRLWSCQRLVGGPVAGGVRRGVAGVVRLVASGRLCLVWRLGACWLVWVVGRRCACIEGPEFPECKAMRSLLQERRSAPAWLRGTPSLNR